MLNFRRDESSLSPLKNRHNDGMPWSDPDYIKGPMVEATKRYILPQREYADVVLDGETPTDILAAHVLDGLTNHL